MSDYPTAHNAYSRERRDYTQASQAVAATSAKVQEALSGLSQLLQAGPEAVGAASAVLTAVTAALASAQAITQAASTVAQQNAPPIGLAGGAVVAALGSPMAAAIGAGAVAAASLAGAHVAIDSYYDSKEDNLSHYASQIDQAIADVSTALEASQNSVQEFLDASHDLAQAEAALDVEMSMADGPGYGQDPDEPGAFDSDGDGTPDSSGPPDGQGYGPDPDEPGAFDSDGDGAFDSSGPIDGDYGDGGDH
ncbi:hypothetical protein ACFRJ9_07070 [Paenarthrobacter sp. NPDC056912]|uniref:hypothetical protein n=1 Tax=Paenarthrobacter sp. NPDC056912 TaxID=3345965 RepID=UPI0036719305